MYKKIINIYKIAHFKYYYSIKPYIIYLKYPILYNYKPKPKIKLYMEQRCKNILQNYIYTQEYNYIIKSYSNHYSIMFLLYIILYIIYN